MMVNDVATSCTSCSNGRSSACNSGGGSGHAVFLAGEFSWCIGAGRMFISEAVAQVQ